MNKMKYTEILVILLGIGIILSSGCVENKMPPVSSEQVQQQQMESNQQTLINSQPAPNLQRSLERENIAMRLQVLNDNSKVFYVYLVNYGKVMAFYTAKTKVSSLNSYMTPMEKRTADPDCINYCRQHSDCDASSCFYSTEAPDQDGSYGMNDNGIFFFTTEGAYVEWKGDYMVSDQPLKLSQPPELVMNIEESDKK